MNTFDRFCDEHHVNYWREPFYHHLMAKGLTDPTPEQLESELRLFLNSVLKSMGITPQSEKQENTTNGRRE